MNMKEKVDSDLKREVMSVCLEDLEDRYAPVVAAIDKEAEIITAEAQNGIVDEARILRLEEMERAFQESVRKELARIEQLLADMESMADEPVHSVIQ